jgi:hypothetical protein
MLTEQTDIPQLDEGLWRIWRDKNEAKDRLSAKRMAYGLMLAAAAAVTIAATWAA